MERRRGTGRDNKRDGLSMREIIQNVYWRIERETRAEQREEREPEMIILRLWLIPEYIYTGNLATHSSIKS